MRSFVRHLVESFDRKICEIVFEWQVYLGPRRAWGLRLLLIRAAAAAADDDDNGRW